MGFTDLCIAWVCIAFVGNAYILDKRFGLIIIAAEITEGR